MSENKFIFRHRIGEKILLFILAFVVFAFFSNDFGLADIQKTAIVLAAGIDKADSGGYSVSATIAVPQSSDTKGKSKETVVTGEGETVAQAFRDINMRTGNYPKLPFCDLIVLGEEVTKEDVFDVLGFFLRNEYMSDNCLLATCDGKASDILNLKLPTEEMTAVGLGRILDNEAKQAGNVSAINLKDFAVGYYSEHQSGYMPLIKPVDKSVSAATTACFYQGKRVATLSEEETFAFNLVNNSIRFATLEVPYRDGIYALGLKNVKGEIDFKIQGEPRLFVSLKSEAQTLDRSEAESIIQTADRLRVPAEVLKEAEKILREGLSSVFSLSQSKGCDLFEVADKLRKYEPRYHEAYKGRVLKHTIAEFKVKVSDMA